MDFFGLPDWGKVLVPSTPLVEIIIRGTVTYLALYVLLRLVLHRQPGAMAMSDILLIVLIADAAQNAMAGDYVSVPDGVILVGTILFWSYALDWLAYHIKPLEPILVPPPLTLVKNG